MCAALCLAAVAPGWGAEGVTTGDKLYNDDFTFVITDIDNRTVRLTDYKGSEADLTIPHIAKCGVVTFSVESIGESAFEDCSFLTTVHIPNSIKYINPYAFRGCSSLTEVTIPTGVKTIGGGAFISCTSLASVTIPNGVTTIGYTAFSGCSSLTSVKLPNSVTAIEEAAFSYCVSLETVVLGNRVSSLGRYAFKGCFSLMSINLPNSLASIGECAFSGCSALAEVNIPTALKVLETETFMDCTMLTSVTIPSGVTEIGYRVFEGCSSLTSANIPEHVTEIGSDAFRDCALTCPIVIPESLTSIGNGVFYGCSLPSVEWNAVNCADVANSTTPFYNAGEIAEFVFTDAVRRIPQYLCRWADVVSVVIGDNVSEIGTFAFDGCDKLTSIVLGGGLKEIRSHWLGSSSLTTITIPEQIESVASSAFNGLDALTSVVWNARACADLEEYNYAFNSTVTSMEFGETVEYIPAHVAAYLPRLTSLKIGDYVTGIGTRAFYGCDSLGTVVIPASVEQMGSRAFGSCERLDTVVWHSVACADFTQDNSPLWYSGTKAIIFGDEVEHIPAYTCKGLDSLTSVTIGRNVSSIHQEAFGRCPALECMTVWAEVPPAVADEFFIYGVEPSTVTVYVPTASLETYRQTEVWKEFNLQALPDEPDDSPDDNPDDNPDDTPDDESGIDMPQLPTGLYVVDGVLHNPAGLPVEVYDLQGRCRYAGSQAVVELPGGVYVVRCGGTSAKVVL